MCVPPPPQWWICNLRWKKQTNTELFWETLNFFRWCHYSFSIIHFGCNIRHCSNDSQCTNQNTDLPLPDLMDESDNLFWATFNYLWSHFYYIIINLFIIYSFLGLFYFSGVVLERDQPCSFEYIEPHADSPDKERLIGKRRRKRWKVNHSFHRI